MQRYLKDKSPEFNHVAYGKLVAVFKGEILVEVLYRDPVRVFKIRVSVLRFLLESIVDVVLAIDLYHREQWASIS